MRACSYKVYPNNFFKPTDIDIVQNDVTEKYVLYKANFRNIRDLHAFLDSNPKVNKRVFPNLASLENDSHFAGIPYDEAVEALIKPIRNEYDGLIQLERRLDHFGSGVTTIYEPCRSAGGAVLDVPRYVSRNPMCYISEREVESPKFIRINVALSYSQSTGRKQVENRAIILIALLNALEREDFAVDVNTFSLSYSKEELININVNMKNTDNTINKSSLTKVMCYIEFLRRILFRVVECMDVKERSWGRAYGSVCSKEMTKKVLNLSDKEIYFDQPNAIGIRGVNIINDFENAVEKLGISNLIDVNESKRNLEREVKRLNLTK